MQKFWVLLFVAAFFQTGSNAQRFIVRFKDKGFSQHSLSNPSGYLSQRALDRRQRFSIPLDSTDLPVTKRYLDSLTAIPGVAVLNSSKWLNQVSVRITDPEALSRINKLPFVLTTSKLANRIKTETSGFDFKEGFTNNSSTSALGTQTTTVYNYGNSSNQVNIHHGAFLHNIGLRGNGKIIGMLDAGYENFTGINSLDSVKANGQILGTWDFVDGNSNVADDNSHGTLCFSILGANIPGTFVGTAPKASYFLFRTEDAFSETPVEEHNWVCGAERIDSAGGDLISSSLGYMVFDDPSLNYQYKDMNGNTTMIAKGADLAAKKGLLVVNAAGNEGNNGWHYIISPADGDSVLAIGSVNANGVPASSSSYGPSFDGQVKPDVASLGQGAAVQYPNGSLGTGNGTSFACPNMAGLITCLMQGFPEFNNIEIINAVRNAGSLTTTPDNRVGYGIPDMRKALLSLVKKSAVVSASIANCRTTLSWTSKDMSAMKYEIERKGPGETVFSKVAEYSGTGNTFLRHDYQYTDSASLSAGIVTYRVKQVIDTTTGTPLSDYIGTATSEISILCKLAERVLITPNPTRNQFTLHLAYPQPIQDLTIRIVSMQGSVVNLFKKGKVEGTTKINIYAPNLSSGQYYVSIYDGNNLLKTMALAIL